MLTSQQSYSAVVCERLGAAIARPPARLVKGHAGQHVTENVSLLRCFWHSD